MVHRKSQAMLQACGLSKPRTSPGPCLFFRCYKQCYKHGNKSQRPHSMSDPRPALLQCLHMQLLHGKTSEPPHATHLDNYIALSESVLEQRLAHARYSPWNSSAKPLIYAVTQQTLSGPCTVVGPSARLPASALVTWFNRTSRSTSYLIHRRDVRMAHVNALVVPARLLVRSTEVSVSHLVVSVNVQICHNLASLPGRDVHLLLNRFDVVLEIGSRNVLWVSWNVRWLRCSGRLSQKVLSERCGHAAGEA